MSNRQQPEVKLTASDLRVLPIPDAENLVKTLLCLGLVLMSFYAADWFAKWLDVTTAIPAWAATSVKWAGVALLALANGVLLVAIAVLGHEGVHRVLFRSPFWNELAGGVLSALVLVPFYANRQYHLTHHGYAHQPGFDPEEPMHNHHFLIAATYGSFIGFRDHYRIVLTNLFRFSDPRCVVRSLRDI